MMSLSLIEIKNNVKFYVRKFLTPVDNTFDSIFDKIQVKGFVFSLFILHVFYFLILINLFGKRELLMKLIKYLNAFIEIYISIFLIIRFHPFRKHELRKDDAPIIFTSALFLLFNLFIYLNLPSFLEKELPPKVYSKISPLISEYEVPNNTDKHAENANPPDVESKKQDNNSPRAVDSLETPAWNPA